MSDKIIIISFDGLSTLDFDYISSLPNFSEYLKSASYCKKVYSIYPTLTYPAHATIVTGKYPKNHGIVNNTLLQEKRNTPDWYWYRHDIKGDTIYDLAIDKGMKVAALLWPVTAKSKIQYNMPEILANRPWQNQIIVSLFGGSPLFQFVLNNKYGNLRDGIKQPNLDNFTQKSLLYTLKNKKPDMTLVHFTDLDSIRHCCGFNSKEAKEALQRHDKRLGEIIEALKTNNEYDNTTIIILGDHSSLDENKVINLNVMFKKRGIIKTDSKGRISSYNAIVKDCDGSAYVYVKDEKEIKSITNLIKEFNQKHKCIERIYTKEEAAELGADNNCSLMLEAKLGYYFQDNIDGEEIIDLDKIKGNIYPKYTKSTHGYFPFKENYTTVFMASGKGIKKNAVVSEMNLVDEAPTIAKVIGIELNDVDGKVIEEFLEM